MARISPMLDDLGEQALVSSEALNKHHCSELTGLGNTNASSRILP